MKELDQFPRKVRKIDPLWIDLPDGTQMAATFWLPEDADSDPVPVILEHLPYRRRDFTSIRDHSIHSYLAGHGYACIRTDIRGAGDTEGVLEGEYLERELQDGYDVIAWAARQPWCSGTAGMTGISWGGFNALQIAALRPPALKAIVTLCSTDDRYADDIHYMGGCHITENLAWASTMFGFNSRPPDPAIVGERWRQMWLERLENDTPWILEWLSHQTRDGFWKHGSVCEDYAAIECAVFAVGGWADGYTNAIPRLLANLKSPKLGLIGPWGHAWPHVGLPGPQIGFLQEMLRWWDHWLKGRDTGIMKEPLLRAWMQQSIAPAPQHREVPGRWVAEEEWPSPRIESRPLRFGAGRTLGNDGCDEETPWRSVLLTGIVGGEWSPYGLAAEMPTDEREEDGRSLCFDSAPLDSDLEILGAPEVELDLQVDGSTGFLAARLCDVAPEGVSARVTYGLINLAHRNGHEHPQPVNPGEKLRVRVRLNDAGHCFPTGHRIRLALSTSLWPLVWPSPTLLTMTVSSADSRLLLPVRPRETEPRDISFGEPEAGRPLPHRLFAGWTTKRNIHQDVENRRTTLEWEKHRGRYHLTEADLTYSGGGRQAFSIVGDDPLSARMESAYTTEFQRGDWHVRTEARTVLTATTEHYLVSAQLDGWEREVRIFSKTWHGQIPRNTT